MTTTKIKTINFKVEDMASINKIMGQRGTLFITAIINSTDCDEDYGTEDDGTYTMQWSSSFSENEPYSISSALRSEMLELFSKSKFNEGEAFALRERTLHDLSYFQKYSIPYMLSHNCARVESLIALAAKSIVEVDITDEVLDADAVDKLIVEIKSSFNKHESNSSDGDMSESKIKAFADILESAKAIEFIHDGLYYEIFESADTGYIVNVYSDDERDEYGEYLEKNCLDGGLCTGSAEDAIGFML